MTITNTDQDLILMSHLMRRAGFGATRKELEERLNVGYEATVDDLLDQSKSRLLAVDSQRLRIQIFNKISNYTDPQFNI